MYILPYASPGGHSDWKLYLLKILHITRSGFGGPISVGNSGRGTKLSMAKKYRALEVGRRSSEGGSDPTGWRDCCYWPRWNDIQRSVKKNGGMGHVTWRSQNTIMKSIWKFWASQNIPEILKLLKLFPRNPRCRVDEMIVSCRPSMWPYVAGCWRGPPSSCNCCSCDVAPRSRGVGELGGVFGWHRGVAPKSSR